MNANAGSRVANAKGQMPGMKDEVWHDDKSKANVFSFSKLAKHHRIACDAAEENAFNVHADKGIVKFHVNKEGLCHHAVSQEHLDNVENINEVKQETNLNMTLEERMAPCAPQQIKDAQRARKLFHNIGAPREENYEHIIQANGVKNCPVTVADVKLLEICMAKTHHI